MYRIVIADDKPAARRGLSTCIDWASFGIELEAVVDDGREALAVCLERKPEILLTDIVMPFKSGLDVARELKEAGSPTRTIIVSGVADFEYARDALELHTEGYLLKPVKIDRLKELIVSIVAALDEERSRKDYIEGLEEKYQEARPLLLNTVLMDLLDPEGEDREMSSLREELASLGVDVGEDERVLCVIAQVDSFRSLKERLPPKKRQLILVSLIELMETVFGERRVCVFQSRENEAVLIHRADRGSLEDLGSLLEDFQSKAKDYAEVGVSVGIGNPVEDLTQILVSYDQAERAVQHRFYIGEGAIVYSGTGTETADEGLRLKREALDKDIVAALEVGDGKTVEDALTRFFLTFPPESPELLPRVQAAAAELLIHAAQKLIASGERTELLDPARRLPELYSIRNLSNLHSWLNGLFAETVEYYSQKYRRHNNGAVEKVKQYIRDHFREDISIRNITSEVYYSPNYISVLFSRQCGQTIKEYIAEERIRYAKGLLRSTDKLIGEISAECGYENAHYFSTIFRKLTGMTPKQYREEPGIAGTEAAED